MSLFPIPSNVVTGGTIQATDLTELYNGVNGNLDNLNIRTGGILGSNLAGNTVGLGQIKSATVSTGVSPTAGNHSNGFYLVLPAGAYSFFPGISTDSDPATRAAFGATVVADTDGDIDQAVITGLSYVLSNITPQPIVWLQVLNPSVTGPTSIGILTSKYLQASPPYDLGDGEIPLFVFALMSAGGDIVSSYVAPDPPWTKPYKVGLNLPHPVQEAAGDPDKLAAMLTALTAHGSAIRRIGELKAQVASAANGQMSTALRSQLAQLESQTFAAVPESQAEKNAHMAKTPHPWVANKDLSGLTPVMLDPTSPVTQHLMALHVGGEDVVTLLHHGYITVGNEAVKGRSGPPGVAVVGHSWKNAK